MQLVQFFEYCSDLFDNVRLVNLVNTVKQRSSRLAEKHEMHVYTAVVVVWPD